MSQHKTQSFPTGVTLNKRFPIRNATAWLRLRTACTARLLPLLLLLALPAAVQAQFNYTTNNGTISITGYTGPGGEVAIPSTIDGLPVTRIGDWAFSNCSSLTGVMIPDSVTSIGMYTFQSCTHLTNITIPKSVTNIGNGTFFSCTILSAITVDVLNAVYSSVDGVLFNMSLTKLIQFPGGKAGSYTIPDNVINIEVGAFYKCIGLTSVTIGNSVSIIGDAAFWYCTNLTNVSIPNSLSSIGNNAFGSCFSLTTIAIPKTVKGIGFTAFSYCTSLMGVYFKGNAPSVGSSVFAGDNNATVYYLPGTEDWSATFADLPTMLWKPQVQTGDVSFGVRTNQFGFNIAWASGQVIVVEACSDLANPTWLALQTNTLSNDLLYFSDPQWTNYPSRFYRLRSP